MHTYGPKSVLGIKFFYCCSGAYDALARQRRMPSGSVVYLLALARFIPSVIVFLYMLQLFQKKEQSC